MSVRPGIERVSHADAQGKVLPSDGSTNILITSALPYVNNAPHLGNIVGSVLPADVYARYSRTRNRPTLYICGTDEYGTASENSALDAGLSPQQLCDHYHEIHKLSYEWFQIGFDHFGRTSRPKQTEITQDIFTKLYKNDYFQPRSTKQHFCTKDDKFLSDRYVEGTCPLCGYEDARGDQCDKCTNLIEDACDLLNPRCKTCGSTPEIRDSKQLALRLDLLQGRIEPWVEQAIQKGQFSSNCQAIIRQQLKKGLNMRDMTRDLTWGVPVPLEGWEKKVFYVWFDAPIGYLSITAEYTDEWKKWWKNPGNVKLCQFMGKDNVSFHGIYFPGYLIGTNEEWTLLHSLSTSEYLQYEGGTKFSKSRNIGVFGTNARDSGIESDVWRYYLLANRPETSDTAFSWDDFVGRNNSELLNKLGNFVNRVLKFVNAKCDSVLPDVKRTDSSDTNNNKTKNDWDALFDDLPESDRTYIEEINKLISLYIEDMENMRERSAISTVFSVAAAGNTYLQSNNFGNELLASDPQRCGQVILVAVNIIYLLSVMLHPFLPTTSDKILQQLDLPPRSLPTQFNIDVAPRHKINPAQHLFKRLDPSVVETLREKYGGQQQKGSGAAPGGVDGQKMSKSQEKKLAKQKKKELQQQQQQQSESTTDKVTDGVKDLAV